MEYLATTTLFILKGCTVTVKLFVITLAGSLPLGFLGAMLKTSGGKLLRGLMEVYTSIARGTPLLLQMFFVYYGLPVIFPGFRMDRFNAAALTFGSPGLQHRAGGCGRSLCCGPRQWRGSRPLGQAPPLDTADWVIAAEGPGVPGGPDV